MESADLRVARVRLGFGLDEIFELARYRLT